MDININTKGYPDFALKLPEAEISMLRRNFIIAKQKDSSDIDRVHEIEQLENAACRVFDGYILACLSRITVYDLSKAPSRRIVTDIDSLLIKCNENSFTIEFHESKNIKKAREKAAAKDLREKFRPILNDNAKGYRIKNVKNRGAKLVIKYKK
ncbi:hypothetical protein [Priestia megaterium]|uniref:hypothetical protein n=1 Tax=Priestia megaterium TaxID=1404 RepID=UPI0015DF025B|nr:hypothetical protein [Priestia megaterium]